MSGMPTCALVSLIFLDLLCIHERIIRRQQYYQQARSVPSYVHLYEVCCQIVSRNPPHDVICQDFISLETEIEESLPKFQELLMSLKCVFLKYGTFLLKLSKNFLHCSHHDQPTKEASAARKRLLESFAQYDKLSKRIRALPCTNGPGSSQDRVQAAILTRANLFLQKNMFPLQVRILYDDVIIQ